jgi:hypothetical protein
VSAIGSSFGIRCPNSIQFESADVIKVFDYESECAWDNMPLSGTAFCGKCSRNSNLLLSNNANTSLTYNYVSSFNLFTYFKIFILINESKR